MFLYNDVLVPATNQFAEAFLGLSDSTKEVAKAFYEFSLYFEPIDAYLLEDLIRQNKKNRVVSIGRVHQRLKDAGWKILT